MKGKQIISCLVAISMMALAGCGGASTASGPEESAAPGSSSSTVEESGSEAAGSSQTESGSEAAGSVPAGSSQTASSGPAASSSQGAPASAGTGMDISQMSDQERAEALLAPPQFGYSGLDDACQ